MCRLHFKPFLSGLGGTSTCQPVSRCCWVDVFVYTVLMSGILSACIDALKAADWPAVAFALSDIVRTVWVYWVALYGFIFNHVRYEDCSSYKDDKWARVQVFSLSLIFKLWNLKHYRSQSFQQDMIDNLRNVAIPGTGVPLSVFCYSYWTCLAYVMVINPLVCLAGAVNKSRKEKFSTVETFVASVRDHFTQHLLHPDDWFSFWRLNCRLVSYHSALSSHPDYLQEDKWTFLVDGKAAGVPVSPFLDNIGSLVCKNKNVEGGMGIHFFRNAAHGGDWILQERLENADWLNALLPANAPLSTMRVITTSTWALASDRQGQGREMGEGGVLGAQPGDDQAATDFVRAESGVLRLGRANASTDHSSVLFDVDIATGRIREGTSNAHWYQLGPHKALTCPWLPPAERVTRHADAPCPEVTGQSIPHLDEALKIVTESHFKLMPHVPIVGWDVAFTPQGVFLLEVNLSCNFFKGRFDVPRYIDFVDKYWTFLQAMEHKHGIFGYKARIVEALKEESQEAAPSSEHSGAADGTGTGLKEE